MKNVALLGLLTVALTAQHNMPAWRSSLLALPERPSPGASVRDIERVEENVRLAAPVLAAGTAEDWQANRELVRRTVAYLAAVHAMNRDPQMRGALTRAFNSVAELKWAYLDNQGPATVPEQQQLSPMPMAQPRPVRRLAEVDNVEIRDRFDLAATQAGVAMELADGIRRNLAERGLQLNQATSTSLARLQVYLERAQEAMQARNWPEAGKYLERAEYETEKVLKTVGG